MYGEGAFFMMATLFDEIDFKDQKLAVHKDATKVGIFEIVDEIFFCWFNLIFHNIFLHE